jgi:hypothetical protein
VTPANRAPVSHAPVRSSATIVSGKNARGVIGGSHLRVSLPALAS